jgi:hypothetical protein
MGVWSKQITSVLMEEPRLPGLFAYAYAARRSHTAFVETVCECLDCRHARVLKRSNNRKQAGCELIGSRNEDLAAN